jgi:hypothetical protein
MKLDLMETIPLEAVECGFRHLKTLSAAQEALAQKVSSIVIEPGNFSTPTYSPPVIITGLDVFKVLSVAGVLRYCGMNQDDSVTRPDACIDLVLPLC